MKSSKILLYLLTCLLFLSCNKDAMHYEINELGITQGLKNGEKWAPSKSSILLLTREGVGNLNFRFDKYNKHKELREVLTFTKLPYASGTYKIGNFSKRRDTGLPYAMFTTLVADGDAIENTYHIDDSDAYDNTLTILEIVEYGDIDVVKGEFQAKFYIQGQNKHISGHPDTIVFEKVEFKASILYYR